MRAWLQRIGDAFKRYWWAALGAAVITGWAIWQIFHRAEVPRASVPATTLGPTTVAEATEQQITETRAVVAEQLAAVERAETQVQQEEQDAHEQIRSGGGDAVDELLYGRKVDGG